MFLNRLRSRRHDIISIRTRRVGLENDAKRVAVVANDFSNLAGLGELLLGKSK